MSDRKLGWLQDLVLLAAAVSISLACSPLPKRVLTIATQEYLSILPHPLRPG